jgi:hypothetical protein
MEFPLEGGLLSCDPFALFRPFRAPGNPYEPTACLERSVCVRIRLNAQLTQTPAGIATIGPADAAKPLPHRAAGILSDGDSVRVQAGTVGLRFLLLAAKPLSEPVVQCGRFVMKPREEIEQALADYRGGPLAAAAPGLTNLLGGFLVIRQPWLLGYLHGCHPPLPSEKQHLTRSLRQLRTSRSASRDNFMRASTSSRVMGGINLEQQRTESRKAAGQQ